jgi:ribosome-associated protein
MSTKVMEIAKLAADAAADKKARDVVILDIEGLSVIADFFVICSGNSSTQVQAIAKEVRERMEKRNIPCKGTEGLDEAKWVLLDFGDIVVHIFRQEEREFYNLERLWGDAQLVSQG